MTIFPDGLEEFLQNEKWKANGDIERQAAILFSIKVIAVLLVVFLFSWLVRKL